MAMTQWPETFEQEHPLLCKTLDSLTPEQFIGVFQKANEIQKESSRDLSGLTFVINDDESDAIS